MVAGGLDFHSSLLNNFLTKEFYFIIRRYISLGLIQLHFLSVVCEVFVYTTLKDRIKTHMEQKLSWASVCHLSAPTLYDKVYMISQYFQSNLLTDIVWVNFQKKVNSFHTVVRIESHVSLFASILENKKISSHVCKAYDKAKHFQSLVGMFFSTIKFFQLNQ